MPMQLMTASGRATWKARITLSNFSASTSVMTRFESAYIGNWRQGPLRSRNVVPGLEAPTQHFERLVTQHSGSAQDQDTHGFILLPHPLRAVR